ncbi:MAG: DUF4124 domain-containing protein [Rhodocyclales bacterium]|nr:DUF4124 domain-containing protein [Rhodocyclales bacterium]
MRMRFLVTLALSLCSLGAAAQLYSWKDANGKIQYSDQPPPADAKVRKVAPPAAQPTDPEGVRKKLAEQELTSRKKQKEAKENSAKAESAKAEAEERRSNCESAQGSLRAVESGQTRFTTDAQGNRVALDGAVREAELARARKAVADWCK